MADSPELPPVAGPGRASPVGRRVVLGMLGAGALGTVFGRSVSSAVQSALNSLGSGGSSLAGLIPGGGYFQLYTVTAGYPATPKDYRLEVDGLVANRLSLDLAAIKALPGASIVRPFQCVTGWRVDSVHWRGAPLRHLLDMAGVGPGAKALRFFSFDGVYTESLSLDQARLPDVLVAYDMLGAPITREHGGPVRLYVPEMYGYKSIKWLQRITVVNDVVPGYWEHYGYEVDAWVGRSNGYNGPGIA